MDRKEKLKEFLALNPADSFLKHALALEYIKEGQDQTARQLLEEVLANDPAYIGSYYHLAKLMDRLGDTAGAIAWYEKGIEAAQKAGDHHALGELRSAYEEMMF